MSVLEKYSQIVPIPIEGIKRAVNDHKAILSAIKERNREKAREMIIQSLMIWTKFIHLQTPEPAILGG